MKILKYIEFLSLLQIDGDSPVMLNVLPQVHSYLTLEPSNTDTWDAWIEPTTQQPLFMKFTFFNVENADEIVANNVKPRVTEKGAFAYREVGICLDICH